MIEYTMYRLNRSAKPFWSVFSILSKSLAFLISRARILNHWGRNALMGMNWINLDKHDGSIIPDRPHSKATHSREVVLRLTVHHEDARALKLFLLEIAPVI